MFVKPETRIQMLEVVEHGPEHGRGHLRVGVPGGMLLMAMALLLFNMRCAAATGVWTNLLGGSWATAANWSHNVIADGVDSTADFNKLNITTDRKVHLDTARTNGNLVFGDTNTGTAAGWTLDNNGGSTNILTLAVSSGSPTITVNALGTGKAATISAGLAGTNGLTKAGAGTLVLPNATTYTGGTMISNGTLLYNLSGMVNGSSLQTNTVGSSGTLTFSNVNAGVDLMLLANTVLTGAGTITKIGAGYVDLWTGSSISGFTGSINVQAGTLAINGAEANAPQMTLNIATGAAFDDRNVSSVVINQLTGSGTLTKSYSGSSPATVSVGNNNGSSTFSGVIQNPSGTVALTKNGTGTFVLGGASTYAGATTVGGGILLVNGSIGTGAVTVKANATLGGTGTINGPVTVQSAGTLAVGTTNLGTLTLASPVALNSGSTNFLRLTKTGGSSTNDVLMTGTLTYGGTLVVTNATGDTNTLAAGDTFKLFPGGSYSGAFTTSNLPPLSGGLRWDTSQLGVGGTIAVVSTNAAAAPLFNPVAGGYIGAQTVTISSLTPGATIYYTTNGTTPTTGSPNAPSGLTITVPVSTTMTIRAFTSAPGYTVSTVARATYATGTNGVWANRAGGSWTDASNWTNNIIASGAGIHADFSQLLLNSAVTVTLDGALTIGNLVFGDGGNGPVLK